MSSHFLSRLLSLLVPPRRTERIVESLALGDLYALRSKDSLPYHQEEVAALVWELKYYGSKAAAALAGEYMAEDLLAIAAEELGRPLLIPIPIHKERRIERGHNQTELLCEAALAALGRDVFDYKPQTLKRIRMTEEQQKLSRERRLNTLKGSMEADPELVRGRVCVVVDDVSTTGATFAEATRALKAAGAARVHCIALAQS